MPLYVPERHKVLEPDGRMSRPWLQLFNDITSILGVIVGPSGVAPADAQYIVAAANAVLSAERVLQDSSTVTWDFATPGQAIASAIVTAFSRRGTRAAQPAAAAVPAGTLYFVTDEKVIERSTGAAWEAYSTAQASAGIATIDLNGQIRATGASTSGISFIGTIVSNSFSSNYIMRRARDGGGGAPAAMQSGDTIAAFATQGHDGTAYGPTNNAAVLVNATENYTTTAKGSEIVFATTPNASTTRANRWKVTNDGHLQAQGGHYIETQEMTAPGAGAAGTVRLYAEDDGAGKTRLMAQFGSGAPIQLAIEP